MGGQAQRLPARILKQEGLPLQAQLALLCRVCTVGRKQPTPRPQTEIMQDNARSHVVKNHNPCFM